MGTFLLAFAGGMLSFLSPCVLPLVPGYLSLMSGVSVTQLATARGADTRKLLQSTLLFVAEFGERVLAEPPRRGFHLLAWLLPLVGGALALVAVGAVARHWRRAGAAGAEAPLDPETERRLDDELDRFE